MGLSMATRRWNDDMLDRMAETMSQLLEGQRLLVSYYEQEHEARVESDRRFNRFMESQERINREQAEINREQAEINRRLAETIEDLRRYFRFSRENGSEN